MRIDKKDIAVYLGFLAITLAFFFRLLDGREVLAFKDLSRYFYPLRYLMVEMVKSGQLPLWNPYIFCGMPFMATLQVGFFYPLTIIHYILPFDLAFNYYTIIHYYLAAVFMYWLMRHYQLSRPSAFLSGLLFAFSGYMLSVSNMNTTLTSVVWLPLVLLSWDRVLKGKVGMNREEEGGGWNKKIPHTPSCSLPAGRHGLISLIIPLSLMFLGGEPTIIYVTGWLMLGYALTLYPNPIKNLGRLALVFIVTGLLVAVQLLPFIELLQNSDRFLLANFQSISNWSFPPREIINFILPFFFGNMLVGGTYSEALLGSAIQTWLLSPYTGLLALILAGYGLVKAEKRDKFFALAGLIGLVLALGRYTPIYALFYKLIPGIATLRYPVKFIFVINFVLAYLAGRGLEQVKGYSRQVWIRYLAGGVGILVLVLVLFKKQLFLLFNLVYPQGLPPGLYSILWDIYSFNISSIGSLFVVLLAFAFLLWLLAKRSISVPLFSGLVIGLVLVDLLATNTGLLYPAGREVYHKNTPKIDLMLKANGLYRFYTSLKVERSARQVRGDTYEGALLNNLDRLTANRLIPFHLQDFNGYESIVPKDHRELQFSFSEGKPHDLIELMSALNIKYIVSQSPVRLRGFVLKQAGNIQTGETFLYLNQNFRPRAFIVHSAEVITDRNKVLRRLNDVKFKALEKIVVEKPVIEMSGARAERVLNIQYSGNEVRIEADIKQPGLLFLSDAYYPGWRVWVNGKEGDTLRANYMFRAVELPAGKSRIKFVYDPLSFKLGLLISALTIFGLLAWGWQLFKRIGKI